MSTDNWITLGIALLSAAYFTGGFVKITRNHFKHLSDDVTAIRKAQKHQDRRINRIETVLMNWTGGVTLSRAKRRKR